MTRTLLALVVGLSTALAVDAPDIADSFQSTVPGVAVRGVLTATPVAVDDTLGYQVFSGPFYGSITLDNASGAFTYTPLPTSSGVTDPLGIRVTDQLGRSATAILRVRITGPDDARPVVISRPVDEFVYAGNPWIYTLTVDATRLDPLNQSNDFTLPSAPVGATITQLTGNQATVHFTPTAGQLGINHISIKIVDLVSHSCAIQQIPIVVLTGTPE